MICDYPAKYSSQCACLISADANIWPRMDYQLPAQNMSIVVDNNANGNPTTQQQLQQLMLVNSCKNEAGIQQRLSCFAEFWYELTKYIAQVRTLHISMIDDMTDGFIVPFWSLSIDFHYFYAQFNLLAFCPSILVTSYCPPYIPISLSVLLSPSHIVRSSFETFRLWLAFSIGSVKVLPSIFAYVLLNTLRFVRYSNE